MAVCTVAVRCVATERSGHCLMISRFPSQNVREKQAVTVSISVPDLEAVGEESRIDARVELAVFRTRFYDCLPIRGDVLFELTDALLCSAVRSAAWSSCP